MTDLFSLPHHHGRKFARHRAFLKALGETGSVTHAAAIVGADLPGFASTRETEFVNESFGDSRPTARYRQICGEINRLAAGAHPGTDGNRVSH